MKINTYGIMVIGLEKADTKKMSVQGMFDWLNEKKLNHLVVEFTDQGIVFTNPARA